MKHRRILSHIFCTAALLSISTLPAFAQEVGSTRVANWKDDKKSAFLVMLDDSIPTDIAVAVPELQKRGLPATFYINPGTTHYQKAQTSWESELPKLPGVVYGNHTMTHLGLKDFESADADLAAVNAIICKAFPGKEPRLISFAKPGVSKDKWTIAEEDYRRALAKNHLVSRETAGLAAAQFNNLKSTEDMLKIVDDGITRGKVRSILFHGIGGDWLVTPTEVFTGLLDGLVARKDTLWVTDHISAHQYETERTSATVKTLSSDAKRITLELKHQADVALYDLPLTLVTRVPDNWKQVQIVQGKNRAVREASNGAVTYDARPNSDDIVLSPAP